MAYLKCIQLQAVRSLVRSRSFQFFILWTLGLLLGNLLSPPATIAVPDPQLSWGGALIPRLVVISCPLALAGLAVQFSCVELLLLVSIWKAICYSYCGAFLYSLFGSAGWLMRFLYQFADIFAVPVFCWFCIRYISGKRPLRKSELLICLIVTLAAGAADHFLVVPFLANIL